uniref:Protein kinase domain-containing protein n=1 Tax=Chromera velia CCMP2878 TaxID=1169474 RepID=A0A0G4HG44_9ALVE|eukprot:Cvel_6683.t1-p1 / transcript=Cvel_6683.t1 / gene=Cvel_6683 / organism=Chromera_velia_CCMP2878 / gene_product=Dual specificity protein kinase TTK, putative / transcript_product=Dual specificity protein kinase TTK, putative / location=Cvel_scaffold332:88509-97603(-) / protein_length=1931 / sequence_SO=supercontig / SO=protein_coding / is_pseudo=false
MAMPLQHTEKEREGLSELVSSLHAALFSEEGRARYKKWDHLCGEFMRGMDKLREAAGTQEKDVLESLWKDSRYVELLVEYAVLFSRQDAARGKNFFKKLSEIKELQSHAVFYAAWARAELWDRRAKEKADEKVRLGRQRGATPLSVLDEVEEEIKRAVGRKQLQAGRERGAGGEVVIGAGEGERERGRGGGRGRSKSREGGVPGLPPASIDGPAGHSPSFPSPRVFAEEAENVPPLSNHQRKEGALETHPKGFPGNFPPAPPTASLRKDESEPQFRPPPLSSGHTGTACAQRRQRRSPRAHLPRERDRVWASPGRERLSPSRRPGTNEKGDDSLVSVSSGDRDRGREEADRENVMPSGGSVEQRKRSSFFKGPPLPPTSDTTERGRGRGRGRERPPEREEKRQDCHESLLPPPLPSPPLPLPPSGLPRAPLNSLVSSLIHRSWKASPNPLEKPSETFSMGERRGDQVFPPLWNSVFASSSGSGSGGISLGQHFGGGSEGRRGREREVHSGRDGGGIGSSLRSHSTAASFSLNREGGEGGSIVPPFLSRSFPAPPNIQESRQGEAFPYHTQTGAEMRGGEEIEADWRSEESPDSSHQVPHGVFALLKSKRGERRSSVRREASLPPRSVVCFQSKEGRPPDPIPSFSHDPSNSQPVFSSTACLSSSTAFPPQTAQNTLGREDGGRREAARKNAIKGEKEAPASSFIPPSRGLAHKDEPCHLPPKPPPPPHTVAQFSAAQSAGGGGAADLLQSSPSSHLCPPSTHPAGGKQDGHPSIPHAPSPLPNSPAGSVQLETADGNGGAEGKDRRTMGNGGKGPADAQADAMERKGKREIAGSSGCGRERGREAEEHPQEGEEATATGSTASGQRGESRGSGGSSSSSSGRPSFEAQEKEGGRQKENNGGTKGLGSFEPQDGEGEGESRKSVSPGSTEGPSLAALGTSYSPPLAEGEGERFVERESQREQMEEFIAERLAKGEAAGEQRLRSLFTVKNSRPEREKERGEVDKEREGGEGGRTRTHQQHEDRERGTAWTATALPPSPSSNIAPAVGPALCPSSAAIAGEGEGDCPFSHSDADREGESAENPEEEKEKGAHSDIPGRREWREVDVTDGGMPTERAEGVGRQREKKDGREEKLTAVSTSSRKRGGENKSGDSKTDTGKSADSAQALTDNTETGSEGEEEEDVVIHTVNGRRFREVGRLGKGGTAVVFRVVALKPSPSRRAVGSSEDQREKDSGESRDHSFSGGSHEGQREDFVKVGEEYALKLVDLRPPAHMGMSSACPSDPVAQPPRDHLEVYKKEVEVLQLLKGSAHVVQMLDFEIDEKKRSIKIVLEFLPLQLTQLLPLELSIDHVRAVASQLVAGLDVLESRKIIHTDLKPQNILLRKKNEKGRERVREKKTSETERVTQKEEAEREKRTEAEGEGKAEERDTAPPLGSSRPKSTGFPSSSSSPTCAPLVSDGDDLEVVLIDFGIAKMQQSQDTTSVIDTDLQGTINYLSPEVCRSLLTNAVPKQNRKGDVFAVGLVLFSMTFKKHPYAHVPRNSALYNHNLAKAISDPREIEIPSVSAMRVRPSLGVQEPSSSCASSASGASGPGGGGGVVGRSGGSSGGVGGRFAFSPLEASVERYMLADFVRACLRKDPLKRAGLTELRNHEFLRPSPAGTFRFLSRYPSLFHGLIDSLAEAQKQRTILVKREQGRRNSNSEVQEAVSLPPPIFPPLPPPSADAAAVNWRRVRFAFSPWAEGQGSEEEDEADTTPLHGGDLSVGGGRGGQGQGRSGGMERTVPPLPPHGQGRQSSSSSSRGNSGAAPSFLGPSSHHQHQQHEGGAGWGSSKGGAGPGGVPPSVPPRGRAPAGASGHGGGMGGSGRLRAQSLGRAPAIRSGGAASSCGAGGSSDFGGSAASFTGLGGGSGQVGGTVGQSAGGSSRRHAPPKPPPFRP